jgi:hypothetical protein
MTEIQEVLIFQLLMLITVANGTPVAAKLILGDRAAAPLDGGLMLSDGHPLFGPSKTVRGVMLAVIATALSSVVLGLGWKVGILVGSVAMAGDLVSSFTKRRLGRASSSQAIGLDQLPESVLPLLACRLLLALSWLDIIVTAALFCAGKIVLSRLLFKVRLRDRPY